MIPNTGGAERSCLWSCENHILEKIIKKEREALNEDRLSSPPLSHHQIFTLSRHTPIHPDAHQKILNNNILY